MGIIKEGMNWPPMNYLNWKQAEHSAWYSGDAETLANFYTEWSRANISNSPYPLANNESFWGRQIKNQGEIYVHVPIASDIAETSANFLFAESPIIRIPNKDKVPSIKASQNVLDKLRNETLLDSKLLEAAESAAAIGGVFIKVAWDSDLSEYPIPAIEQADKSIPEFKFGMLYAVTFWKVIEQDESGSKVYRLLERYEKGSISYSLWLGTSDKLGKQIELKAHPDTEKQEKVIKTIDMLLAVYIPNMLPNRLSRGSSLGRSDYSGIEGLMDSLDEVYTSWVKDIVLAQAKILIPEQFMRKHDGKMSYNIDKMLYVQLDIDPLTLGSTQAITPQQFEIRAEQFETTSNNLLERIISSAGYSPQSFGLNIAGKAESGTALSMRERKSFATKGKKENYWYSALEKIIKMLMLVYRFELNGSIDTDVEVNIEFNDGVTNNLSETAASVQLLNNAMAVSTDTKVRLVHPEWDEEQIETEVQRIIEENNIGAIDVPELDKWQTSYTENEGE